MRSARHVLPRGWGISTFSEPIRVQSMMASADPDWTYTDAAGHEHRAERGLYPTLKWIETERYWCTDCRDEHTEGRYECPLCGQHIVPGKKMPSPYGETIPGMYRVVLTGPAGQEIELSPDEIKDVETRGAIAVQEIIDRQERNHV